MIRVGDKVRTKTALHGPCTFIAEGRTGEVRRIRYADEPSRYPIAVFFENDGLVDCDYAELEKIG